MRLIASDIALSLDAMIEGNRKAFMREVSHALGVKPSSISDVRIERKSIDARKKDNVHFVVSVSFDPVLDKPLSFWQTRAKRGVKVDVFHPRSSMTIPTLDAAANGETSEQQSDPDLRPIIVGAGPAGLFCALYLARAGMRPVLIERGQQVEKRLESVRRFNEGAPLDPESNIQFGEGGAGTFSDGKLNTGTRSPYNSFVLEQFVAAGAPEDILIDAKPHIGTDHLIDVVAGIRKMIIACGGEVLFSTRLTGINLDQDRQVCAAIIEQGTAGSKILPTNRIVLATGHSARDVFDLMKALDVRMERKPFAVGVRIEHPQKLIDAIQYGKAAGHPALPSADYKLAVKTSDGRGVYSFCMCPGGSVVAATSEEGGVCVNGMSDHARDGDNANSAILVEIKPDDLEGDDVLCGVAFQRQLERAAYELGGGCYSAPCQRLGDLLGKRTPPIPSHLQHLNKRSDRLEPTYPRGVKEADLRECLPKLISDALAEGLVKMDSKMRGFAYKDAMLTATEARSSSPVRVIRDRVCLRSVNTPGLYPTGEGAGYAGGIMSAATDGLRVAARIVEEVMLEREIAFAVGCLREGGMVVFPTDTVCAIGMSAMRPENVGSLYKAKGRRPDKPLQWLVADADSLDEYGSCVPSYAKALAKAFWPGGLTLVVRASKGIADALTSTDGTIGLRMPSDEVSLRLIRELGDPIVATSANRSGETPSTSIDGIDEGWLGSTEAYVIHGFHMNSKDEKAPAPSTVVDCTGEDPRIIRQGCISVPEIMAAI